MEADNSEVDSQQQYEIDSAKLTQSGLQTFALKVSAVGLAFLAHLLIANLLGKVGYGEYAFALTTLNFLIIAAVAGSDTAATRFIADYHSDSKLLDQHRQWLNHRTLRISVCTAIAALILLQLVRWLNPREIWLITQLIAIAIPLQAFSIVRQGILRGLRRPVLSLIPEGIFRPLFTIKFMIVAYLLVGVYELDFSPVHAVGVYIFVSIFVFLAGQIFLRGALPSKNTAANPLHAEASVNDASSSWHSISSWHSMAFASMFSAAAMTVHAQSDVWMLGVLTDADMVGPYSSAAKYAAFVVFGINAINTSLAPMISQAKGDKQALQHLASKGAKISFWIGLPISAVFFFAPTFVLSFFGEGFSEAAFCLQVLAAANLFNVCCGSVGILLSMTGNHSTFMKLVITSVILNVLLNGTFIPIWGSTGAAFATATSIIYWNVAALIVVRKKLGIRPAIFGIA